MNEGEEKGGQSYRDIKVERDGGRRKDEIDKERQKNNAA